MGAAGTEEKKLKFGNAEKLKRGDGAAEDG
jgi:hypothetical protein